MRRTLIVAVVVGMTALAVPAMARTLPQYAVLKATNEVGGGDGNATGHASLSVDPRAGIVCFEIRTQGLTTDPVAAHIHYGAAGVNGPVVVDLDWATNGSGANASGCVSGDRPTLSAIQRYPWNYYVNVHNPTVPSGAVRGQVQNGQI